MTLDDAIRHAEEKAEQNEEIYKAHCRIYTKEVVDKIDPNPSCKKCAEEHRQLAEWLRELKQLREQTRWVSVSERLPEELEPVNITWVNHEPEPYYHDIKDKNFVATGIHYRDQWYWYSTTCADYLGEYGSNEIDLVDDAIEIIAWMPLPESYKAESEERT